MFEVSLYPKLYCKLQEEGPGHVMVVVAGLDLVAAAVVALVVAVVDLVVVLGGVGVGVGLAVVVERG